MTDRTLAQGSVFLGLALALAPFVLAPFVRADDSRPPRAVFLEAVEAEARDHAWERAASLYERVAAERDIPDDLRARAEARRARCRKRLAASLAPAPAAPSSPASVSKEGSLDEAWTDAVRAFVEKASALANDPATPISEAGRVPCALGAVRDAGGRGADVEALREKLAAAIGGSDALELVGRVASPDPAFVVCPELAATERGVVARLSLVSVESLEVSLAVEAASPRPASAAPSPSPVAAVFSASVHQPFARQSCPSCHDQSEKLPRGVRAREAWTRCLDCHDDLGPGKKGKDGKPAHHPIQVPWDAAKTRPGRPLRLEGGKVICITCHQQHESKFPHLLRDYDASGESPRALCLRCHEK